MNADNRSSSSAEFFVAGGTLPATAPSYVSRPADEQLLDAAVAGRFCYVLTTRQMGKSSLMVRTARRLKQQDVRTAIIDLTLMGGKTEATWYLDFLTELSDQLNVQQDVEAWWQERATHGPVQRFSKFLRDVVLEEIGAQIVIFVDEIDFTLGLPFADDFFAAVRATYNARALDAKFNRLTFIFLGVAAPADLIKDRTRTPFNIGEGIVLRDFDRTDAAVLQQGLETAYPEQGQVILDRVFYWTAGHPYLTQKLCHEVVEAKRTGPWTEADVDRVVNDLFLSDQTNREQNLQFVQDRVLKNPHRRELLKLYGKVRAGKAVANDEQSVPQNQLKLAGLVTSDDGQLRVHNQIYRDVFDAKWIKANTLRDSNLVIAYAAVALAVLVVGLAGFVLLRNSYVQQESDRLQLEFTQAGTSYERLVRLAQLFELQGILNASNFDDAARRLFFEMNSRQDQLALFDVQDGRVVGVIEGLYTALADIAPADVNKSGENDELLKAMRDALQGQTASPEAVRLKNEIDYWLKAREYAQQNQYNDALAEYGKAIQANPDDSNPATHFERARIMLRLPSPIYPQASNDLDAAIAAASKVSVAGPGEAEAEATPTSTPTQVVSNTPNSTSVPAVVTRVVGPTILPTIATSGQTPVPVPPAIGQPQPPLPPDAGQHPFRSQFITFGQIASAVQRLIDSSPNLVDFLAKSAQSDYGNLRVANLVRTLTPTPIIVSTGTPQLIVQAIPSAVSGGITVKVNGLNFKPNDGVVFYLRDPAHPTEPIVQIGTTDVTPLGTIDWSFIYPSDARWTNVTDASIIVQSTATGGYVTAPLRAVPVGATPVPPTPDPEEWRGEYFNNPNLQGSSIMVRNDPSVNFDWGASSPMPNIPVNYFSARWTRSFNFDAGMYRFTARADDGVRVWLDSTLIIDEWHAATPNTYLKDINVPPGQHAVRVEYYEGVETASINFNFDKVTSYPDWKGDYYSNQFLSGSPTYTRNDVAVSFDWSTTAPAPGVPNQNFSVRWTRNVEFSPGNYRFTIRVNGGANLLIDGSLIIDQWNNNVNDTFTADYSLSSGSHSFEIDYYNVSGNAYIWFTYQPLTGSSSDWNGNYFANDRWSGIPTLVRFDPNINFDWGTGSPAPLLPVDRFTVRWTRVVNLAAGLYQIDVTVDDGVRVYVDNNIVLDQVKESLMVNYTTQVQLTQGNHEFRIEYVEYTGQAQIVFKITPLDVSGTPDQ